MWGRLSFENLSESHHSWSLCLNLKEWHKKVGCSEMFWRPEALNFLLLRSSSVPQLWNRISYYRFSCRGRFVSVSSPWVCASTHEVHQPHLELCSLKMNPCPFYSSLWQLSRKRQSNLMLSFPCLKVIQVTVLPTLPCLVGLKKVFKCHKRATVLALWPQRLDLNCTMYLPPLAS